MEDLCLCRILVTTEVALYVDPGLKELVGNLLKDPFAGSDFWQLHSARGGPKHQQSALARRQSSLDDQTLDSSAYVSASSTYDGSDSQTVELLHQRRVDSMISHPMGAEDIVEWFSALNHSTGQWPDANYATKCAAQRAN
ncbi:hypothetical protein DFS33DRAFT_1379854 [Desarmillaria ectypa]|nr:hypothetical protein DFS33DRAFT_1379854 [Desarmillaria ectypa]